MYAILAKLTNNKANQTKARRDTQCMTLELERISSTTTITNNNINSQTQHIGQEYYRIALGVGRTKCSYGELLDTTHQTCVRV